MAQQTTTQAGFRPAAPAQGELVPRDDGALSTIPRGGTSTDAEMMRVSTETARRYPRNEERIIARLVQMVETYAEFAEKAIYQIDYKDARSPKGYTTVTGMSIRAAETIAAEWEHVWVGARIAGETEDAVDVEALCVDVQRNNRVMLPYRVSKYRKTRQGVELMDDRTQLMTLQSGISKARRNAIMATLPLHVKEAFYAAVLHAIAGGDLKQLADKDRVAKCLAAFAEEFQVDLPRLERYVGKPKATWTGGNLAKLRTLYTAIETGEVSLEDAFAAREGDAPTEVPPAPTAGATVESATDGHLSPGQKAGAKAPPRAGREEPAPKPAPKPASAPEPAPAPRAETKAERLKRELAEAEAEEAASRPPAPSAQSASAEPAAPGTLAARIAGCATVEDIEALVAQMYAPGGEFESMSRADKRVVMAQIGERRDQLAQP